jgi:bacteriophage N4 adsorption protein B
VCLIKTQRRHADMEKLYAFLFLTREELLLFSGFFFLIGGLDDIVVDLIWGIRSGWRRLTRYRRAPPMRAHQLPSPAYDMPLAILVPAWREASVIGKMLQTCLQNWANSSVAYRIYVGCYANDSATVRAVMTAASGDPKVRLVLCKQSGPTTKADCLNRLWRAVSSNELAGGYKYKAIILHDAEDYVHPMELAVFAYLIERAAAVQLPVIPIQVPGSAWVSGHYCDEFAEAHGKSLIVREAIGASLPLAGVGCAIERNRLGRLAISRNGSPFDADSLTEDYELGLGLGVEGGKVIFAHMLDENGALVGTRACFPSRFETAARQKARWMTGIALAGWDRLGWQGGIAETWMRLRDRKAVFAAIVLTAAYLAIALTPLLIGLELAGFAKQQSISSAAQIILILTLVLLCWRISVRMAFVWMMHGPKQALLSIPRGVIANIIAIAAARRASWTYLTWIFGGKLHWDKTEHNHFPEKASQHG